MQVLGFAGAMVVGVLVAGAMVKMITWRSPTVPEEAPWELRPACGADLESGWFS